MPAADSGGPLARRLTGSARRFDWVTRQLGGAGRRLIRRCARAARWLAASLAAIALLGLLLALAGGLALSHADDGPVAAWAKSTGHDAVWLGRA